MKKILKIRFVKFEKALAMQILEQQGLPEEKSGGLVRIEATPLLDSVCVFLRGELKSFDLKITSRYFGADAERDSYLKKAVEAITDELFTSGPGELKVGEICEVKDLSSPGWNRFKLLGILPEGCKSRFIAEYGVGCTGWAGWDLARPIARRTEPRVQRSSRDDAIYTWEVEGGND